MSKDFGISIDELLDGKYREIKKKKISLAIIILILIGMGEIRHNLKPLGIKTIGHIACGIRPSKRQQGYALKSTECMIEKLKEDGVDEVVLCHYSENNISPKIIKKLDFKFRDSVISKVSKKEIKCYTKKIR